jgi:flavorubredoxin
MAAQNAVRLRVAQELLETERSYYHSLSQLNKYLIQPVKKANVLSTQEFDRMFSNIEFIVDGHGKLLQRLETVMASWSETSSIAPIFANTVVLSSLLPSSFFQLSG